MSFKNSSDETYQPFGDNPLDYGHRSAESDSYRYVRIGVYLMLAGYSLLIPSVIFTIFAGRGAVPPAPILIGVALAALFVGMGMLAIGCLFLLAAPKANEKQIATRFIVAQGIAVAITIAQRFIPAADALEIVQRLASAYGTYYLINFFQVLAQNRGSLKLLNIAQRLNYGFVALIILSIAAVFFGAAFGVKLVLGLMTIAFGIFLLLWFQTLWVAISVTKVSHQREFAEFAMFDNDLQIDNHEDFPEN